MQINEITTEILKEHSGMEAVNPDDKLTEDLAIDSLGMVALLIEIEERFQTELDESDMNPFDLNTVKDVTELINKYCGDKNEKDS